MGCFQSVSENPHQIDLTHFRVHRVLGKGGFGKVNVVENRRDKKLLAMKALKKAMLLQSDSSFETAWLERKVSSQFKSNFLVNCYHAFQDSDHLYILMPLMEGGDLRYYLNRNGTFSESECKFYAAQIILGIESMHTIGIIYRDLKPENCLLDGDGFLRVSDFGLCYQLNPNNKSNHDGKTQGYCGTSGYVSPEILRKQRYSYSVDYFSLGVLIYELLHHRLPKLSFYKRLRDAHKKEKEAKVKGVNPPKAAAEQASNENNENNGGNENKQREDSSDSKNSSSGTVLLKEDDEIYFSSRLTPDCIDFISKLLIDEPDLRLGCKPGDNGWEAVKSHKWFADMNWNDLAAKKVYPPLKIDTSIANFDPMWELEEQIMNAPEKPRELSKLEQTKFVGWEFHTKLIPDGSGRYLDDHTMAYDFTIDNNLNRHFDYSTTAPAWARGDDQNPLDDDTGMEMSRNDHWNRKAAANDPELEVHESHHENNSTSAIATDRTKDAALVKDKDGALKAASRRISGYHEMK